MPVGSDPEEFAISLDGSKLYVANEDVGLASVVDAGSGQIIKTLPVGDEPEGVGISPDGKMVYVTSETTARFR
jgi:YVTN family beta-propeller protein